MERALEAHITDSRAVSGKRSSFLLVVSIPSSLSSIQSSPIISYRAIKSTTSALALTMVENLFVYNHNLGLSAMVER